jgi:hypothetical protein
MAKPNATKPDDTASKLTEQERVISFCAATGVDHLHAHASRVQRF